MPQTNGNQTNGTTKVVLKTVVKNNRTYYKCPTCGKLLTNPQSYQNYQCGPTCHKLATNGYTTTSLQAAALAKTVTQLPAGYFKTALLHKVYQKLGLPINRFVTAMGGDRGLQTPLPGYQYLTYNRARYLPGYCFSLTGIQAATGQKITKNQLLAALVNVFGKTQAQLVANHWLTGAPTTSTTTNTTTNQP